MHTTSVTFRQHELRLRDGRHVTVDRHGKLSGRRAVIVLLHGSPGSRLAPLPELDDLLRFGVELVTFDRAGYGDASRHPNHSLADGANDVADILRQLGYRNVSVIGRSGGGPYALAFASLHPQLVSKVVTLSCPCPITASFDVLHGVNFINTSLRDVTPAKVRLMVTERVDHMRDDPEWFPDHLMKAAHPLDRPYLETGSPWRPKLIAAYNHGLQQGPEPWTDDHFAMFSPDGWPFDLRTVETPVEIWHGLHDNFSTVAGAYWLAEQLPNSVLTVDESAAHFGNLFATRSYLRILMLTAPLLEPIPNWEPGR